MILKVDKMSEAPNNLIAAVKLAAGRKLDLDCFADLLIIQKGCYILNAWGYGPHINYSQFFKGPFSLELADFCETAKTIDNTTDVPTEGINRLSKVISKGDDYLEAYATVLMIIVDNPNITKENVIRHSLSIKPNLSDEIMEVSESLLA